MLPLPNVVPLNRCDLTIDKSVVGGANVLVYVQTIALLASAAPMSRVLPIGFCPLVPLRILAVAPPLAVQASTVA